eukprot:3544050-Rhodomonas_salina.4
MGQKQNKQRSVGNRSRSTDRGYVPGTPQQYKFVPGYPGTLGIRTVLCKAPRQESLRAGAR